VHQCATAPAADKSVAAAASGARDEELPADNLMYAWANAYLVASTASLVVDGFRSDRTGHASMRSALSWTAGRARVDAALPHLRALGSELVFCKVLGRCSFHVVLEQQRAGVALRVHLGGSAGLAVADDGVRARWRGHVRERDGADDSHIPVGRPRRHRRAVSKF